MSGTKGRESKSRNAVFFFLLIVFSSMGSCRMKTAKPKEYLHYIQSKSSGLVQEKEIDKIVFEVRYLTPEAMALNELKSLTPEKKEFKKALKEYEGLNYYQMKIRSKDPDGHIFNTLKAQGFSSEDIERHLRFEAQNKISVEEGKDTCSVLLYSFSETYGLSKDLVVALGTENKDTMKIHDKTFDFDADILNRGLLKFKFNRSDLNKIPKLEY